MTKIALQACNGKYVCAEIDKEGALVANRAERHEWETFTLIKLM